MDSIAHMLDGNYDGPFHTRAAFAFTTVSPSDSLHYTSLVRSDLVVDVVGFFSD